METILAKHLPIHLRLASGKKLTHVPEMGEFTDADYDNSMEIPHLLNYDKKGARVIIQRETIVSVGDAIRNEYGFERNITEIIERRPARGDWSLNQFCSNPDFLNVSFV